MAKWPRYVGTLSAIERCTETFGSLTTNRQCTRGAVLRCVRRGYARSVGIVTLSDGYGSEPERFAEGFVLTDAGRVYLAAPPMPAASSPQEPDTR